MQQPHYSNPNMNPMMQNPMNNQPGMGMMGSMGFDPYQLARQLIVNYADSIFSKYDTNQSGYLDVKEIYPATCEIFRMNCMQAPSYQHVLMLMRYFDNDGNGLLDRNEFRNFLLKLNGHQV